MSTRVASPKAQPFGEAVLPKMTDMILQPMGSTPDVLDDGSVRVTGSRKRARPTAGGDSTAVAEEEKRRGRGRPRLETNYETAVDVSSREVWCSH